MDAQTQLIAIIIIAVTFIINATLGRRRDATPMRRIRAFEALPTMTGASIEASRPLHVSLGSATLGDDTTLLALVGKEFIYYLAREVAVGDEPAVFTVSDTAALPLALATMRRAYEQEDRLHLYNFSVVRWYPSSSKRLAYAAALMSMQVDDKVTGNVLAGRYGVELALILDASERKKSPSLAFSDLLQGQAIAYALADQALIGEEIFAAPGYLGDDVRLINRNVIMDYLRFILILTILGFAIGLPLFDLLGG